METLYFSLRRCLHIRFMVLVGIGIFILSLNNEKKYKIKSVHLGRLGWVFFVLWVFTSQSV